MIRITEFAFLGALTFSVCSCYTPPRATAVGRPEVKIVDYADVTRRHLVPAKTHFYRTDTVAICVHGFAGRTVTLEVREQQRGLVKTWSQYIAAPHVRTQSGVVYRNIDGYQSAERREYKTQVEQDYVVEWPQPPPGNYMVRVVSNEGIVQQASFSVSN